MKITIRGVDHYADLVAAIASLTNSALILGFFDQEEAIFSPVDEPPVPTADELAEMVGLDACSDGDTDQLELPLPDGAWQIPGPTKYAPCPQRGQHQRLTDCWQCWCDHLLAEYGDPWGERR